MNNKIVTRTFCPYLISPQGGAVVHRGFNNKQAGARRSVKKAI